MLQVASASGSQLPLHYFLWLWIPAFAGTTAGVLLLERAVDQVLQRGADAAALRDGLRHEHHEHVFLRIDPKGCAGRAGPVHLADGSLHRADAGLGAHGEAKPKAKART